MSQRLWILGACQIMLCAVNGLAQPMDQRLHAGQHYRSTLPLSRIQGNEARRDSTLQFTWEEDSAAWRRTQSVYYSYGMNSDTLLTVLPNYGPIVRNIYEYDIHGRLRVYLGQQLIGQTWISSAHWTYSYNPENQLTAVVKQYRNAGTLEDFSSESYSYDNDGALIERTEQRWEQNAWQNYKQTVYENNSDQQPLQETVNLWENAWEPESRSSFMYGSAKELVSNTHEIWNNGWEIDYIYDYVYNAQLQVTNAIYNQYSNGIFFRASQSVFTYDDAGNISIETSQIHDGIIWNTYSRNRRTYDADQHEISLAIDYWWENEWVVSDSLHYFWSVISSNQYPIVANEQLRVFPNPASDELQFDVSDHNGSALTYSIVSIDGVQRQEGNADAKCSIDVSGLPHGIHVLSITSRDGKQYLKCFLKQ
jgi:hypothetical protein